MRMSNESRIGERLEFPSSESVSLVRSHFKTCTIRGKTAASNLNIVECDFEDCSFSWTAPLRNMNWLWARFAGCKFTGKYWGNQFGRRPGDVYAGSIVDCDFREAQLDGVGFMDCDMSTIRLPGEGLFVIWNPVVNRDAILNAAGSSAFRVQTKVRASCEGYENTSAVVWSIDAIAKSINSERDAVIEELRKIPFSSVC